MNDGLIPQRYARALYKYTEEHGTSASVYSQMKTVADAFVRNDSLGKVLSNPFVDNSDKSRLLLAAAGEHPEDDYRAFVRLLISKKRAPWAREMALCYRDLYRRAHNVAMVKITTATPLPGEEMKRIRAMVTKAFDAVTLEFTQEVNADIIGGFVIDVDSVRMDASLRNELEKIRLTLLSN